MRTFEVNIGAGNGLVPSGNKPLPEPMLIQIYVVIRHHKATELNVVAKGTASKYFNTIVKRKINIFIPAICTLDSFTHDM